ncbi:MAG: PIG-L family deacetylase [Bacteroidota bacterium]
MILKKLALLFLIAIVSFTSTFAQKPQKPTASEIYHDLQKLNFLGSAMYIAAHPDDENTRLISYLSNDLKARTAYLSMTRGDGGQNLIGPEIRELLGVIRTQELVAARNTDGGSQLFTRANDFGFSRHPDETLAIWNKDEVMSDVVRAIRKFKPDILVNRFDHRTPGTNHGHHTSSAMLSFEAFDLVGNPNIYTETAKEFGVWRPKRLFFNSYWSAYGSREDFEKVRPELTWVQTGNYYPSLGLSNGEIAALSRSMHKSQGFGNTGRRGNQTEYLELLKGDAATDKDDLFEGINTTWTRLEEGAAIGAILSDVEDNFDFKDPSASVPQLVKAYALIQKIRDPHWRTIKTEEIKELIINCSGLYLEAVANQQTIAPKGNVLVTLEAINRSNVPMQLNSVTSSVIQFPSQLAPTPLLENIKQNITSTEFTFNVTENSTPYWLNKKGTLGMYHVENAALIGLPVKADQFPVHFHVSIAGTEIDFVKNIIYKFNDPVKGEVYRPFEVLPEATSAVPEKVLIFSSEAAREIPVVVTSGRENITGTVNLLHPKGWIVSPAQHTFSLGEKGASQTVVFSIKPPKDQSEGFIKPVLQVGDNYYDKELFSIDYDHIPFQNVLMPSQAKVVRIPIEKRGENIGYIDGAGDAIPESLKQIGYTVTTIVPSEITTENLVNFDAVVVGIRAYNTVSELKFKQSILDDYVANGGTLLLQYNTSHRLITKEFSPYPIKLSRDRVTDEFADVTLLAPDHPALNTPNKITATDFNGWVQERGLYFPSEWAPEYTPILGMHDKDYPDTQGSLLVAKHGKGYYVYTGLSFFRELPAGVSGAYRLFANLLSLGKS